MDFADHKCKLVLPIADGQVQEFVLGKTVATVGRASTNDIVVSDPKVSRSHARIECTAAGYTIEDLHTANGTCVNGEAVSHAVLRPGDVITLGSTTLKFESISDRPDVDATIVDETGTEEDVAENSIPIRLHDNKVARVIVRSGDTINEFALQGEALSIGRAPDNDIILTLPNVSRHHARVERTASGYILRDLNSENGTWMERCRITQAKLRHGDAFRIGLAQLAFKQSFAPEELFETAARSEEKMRRPLVIVPGIAGSKLWLGDHQVWPGLGNLLANSDVLKYSGKPLHAQGLVDQAVIIPNLLKLEQYSRLSEYMQDGLGYELEKNLLEFAYDFRQDVRVVARELADVIENWRVPRPITIIAHSMGCLVSRYYVERLGGYKHIGRLILMGGPHNGAPKALSTLLMGPRLLPFGLLDSQLREVFATFPSIYQMVPAYACVATEDGSQIDLLEHSTWLPDRQRSLLKLGRDLRSELGQRSRVLSTCIFGYGLKTITSIVVKSKPGGSYALQSVVEPKGDGTVPETSAMLPESEIHPVRQYHGTLFVDNDVKMRLKIELMRASSANGRDC
jgi:pSer/pThr/pTyr-binding forkhead associated (FHA) protein